MGWRGRRSLMTRHLNLRRCHGGDQHQWNIVTLKQVNIKKESESERNQHQWNIVTLKKVNIKKESESESERDQNQWNIVTLKQVNIKKESERNQHSETLSHWPTAFRLWFFSGVFSQTVFFPTVFFQTVFFQTKSLNPWPKCCSLRGCTVQALLLSDTDNLFGIICYQLQLLSNLDNLASKKGKVWSMT